jgi:hypothetical protein
MYCFLATDCAMHLLLVCLALALSAAADPTDELKACERAFNAQFALATRTSTEDECEAFTQLRHCIYDVISGGAPCSCSCF